MTCTYRSYFFKHAIIGSTGSTTLNGLAQEALTPAYSRRLAYITMRLQYTTLVVVSEPADLVVQGSRTNIHIIITVPGKSKGQAAPRIIVPDMHA